MADIVQVSFKSATTRQSSDMAAAVPSAASASAPTPTPTADSRLFAADWERMWHDGVPPGSRFDIAAPNATLQRLIRDRADVVPAAGRALVPGCGRGHDVAALASATRLAIGLDIAPTAVDEARRYCAEQYPAQFPHMRIECADFFALDTEPAFDVAYDLTFLCALPPSRRSEWAQKYASIIRPGGTLITIQYPLPPPSADPAAGAAALDFGSGPPFLLLPSFYTDLLVPVGFECILDEAIPASESKPTRVGRERLAVWRRRVSE